MRRALMICLFAAALTASCASSAPRQTTRATGGWTWAYDAASGVASAQQADAAGNVTVRVTCQAPDGDLTIRDSSIMAGGRLRGQQNVQFRVGNEAISVRGAVEGGALVVRMPRRPPNLQAYAHVSREPVSLIVGGRTVTYAEGAIEKIALVANSCWPTGS